MIGVVIALVLSTVSIDPLTARIAESALAAQALQGAFDGAWVLHANTGEGILYHLQITDPPDSVGTLVGVWSGPHGETGAVKLTRRVDKVDLVMDTQPEIRLTLRSRGRSWSGTLPSGATVVLTPHLATP